MLSARLLELPKHSPFPLSARLSLPFFFSLSGACVLPSLPRLKLTLLGLTRTCVRAERVAWFFGEKKKEEAEEEVFRSFWEMVLKSVQSAKSEPE